MTGLGHRVLIVGRTVAGETRAVAGIIPNANEPTVRSPKH